jgi:hypothetical protein
MKIETKNIHTVSSYAKEIGVTPSRVWQLMKEEPQRFLKIIKRGGSTILVLK